MAVIKAPRRQQDYLTEYDRQMAQYLRQMGGSIGAQDIAAEAYGGKFPVGTMTAKILSGVLARASEKRAMNREEMGKDYSSKAYEIADAQNRGVDAMPGQMGVNQAGNLDLLPTTALQTTDGVTNRQPYVFKEDSLNDGITGPITNNATSYATNTADEREMLSKQRVDAFANASSESPSGVPYARQNVALTVGEPTGDSTQLGRYLSGTLEQDILPTNANKALSASLRGANIDEREFADYRLDRKMATMPQTKTIEVYDKQNNRIQITASFNPTTGKTSFFDELQKPIDISQYTQKPYDLAVDDYTVTDLDGARVVKSLTKIEVANAKKLGMAVVKYNATQSFASQANNIIGKNINEPLGFDPETGDLINTNDGTIKLKYYVGNNTFTPTLKAEEKEKQIEKENTNINDNTSEFQLRTPEEQILAEEELENRMNNDEDMLQQAEKTKDRVLNFYTTPRIDSDERQLKNIIEAKRNASINSSAWNTYDKQEETVRARLIKSKESLSERKSYFELNTKALKQADKEINNFEQDIKSIQLLLRDIQGPNVRRTPTELAAFMRAQANFAGTASNQIKNLLTSLGGRVAFQALADMRKASKTGGAVGQLSDKELEVLGMTQGVISFGNIEKSVETLRRLVDNLKIGYDDEVKIYEDDFNRKWAGS
jgi:hypothetical protein